MSFPLAHIAERIGAPVTDTEGARLVHGVAALEDAGPEDISFLANARYTPYLAATHAGAVIVAHGVTVPPASIALAVDDPYFAFLTVLTMFSNRTATDIAATLDPRAVVHDTAVLGDGVALGPFAVVGPDVTIGAGTVIGPGCVVMKGSVIGDDAILYPNVTIMDGCILGNRVIVHAGAVIGADGFGFAPHGGRLHKIPQIGGVRIGDDVEIGANACIDRAAFGMTSVGDGAKIDNLVQLGHNVRVGPSTVIASQSGISGSTTIGMGVQVGGQAGFAGHLVVGDGASVGAQAGVTKDVPPGETVSGYPAKKHMQALRLEAALRALPDLIGKVRAQERRIGELERELNERR